MVIVSKYMNDYWKEWNNLYPCWMEKVMHFHFKIRKIEFKHQKRLHDEKNNKKAGKAVVKQYSLYISTNEEVFGKK